MVKRYDMVTEYNKFACEDQVVPVEDSQGEYVKFEDYAAQVKALERVVISAKARGNLLHSITLQILQGAGLNSSDWDYISESQVAEIEQHLAEIKAQAGRAGFIAGAKYSRSVGNKLHRVITGADEYADSIRQEK